MVSTGDTAISLHIRAPWKGGGSSGSDQLNPKCLDLSRSAFSWNTWVGAVETNNTGNSSTLLLSLHFHCFVTPPPSPELRAKILVLPGTYTSDQRKPRTHHFFCNKIMVKEKLRDKIQESIGVGWYEPTLTSFCFVMTYLPNCNSFAFVNHVWKHLNIIQKTHSRYDTDYFHLYKWYIYHKFVLVCHVSYEYLPF